MPASPYIEARGEGRYQGCFVTGTRISLDTVVYSLRRGERIEQILEDYPSLEPRETLERVIDYIRDHPAEIENYLAEGEQLWNELQAENPPEIMELLRKYDEAKRRKTA